MKKNILILLMLALCSKAFAEYNIVERTTLIEDRLKLQESLRPRGHDFFIDANAFFSTDALDLADDLQTTAERIDSLEDDNEIISEFSKLTDKWSGKELGGRLNFGAGIPLFQFEAWGIKFVPELIRADFGFTANVAVSTEKITSTTILNLLSQDDRANIPPEVLTVVSTLENNDFSVGATLYSVLVAQDAALEDLLDLPQNAKAKNALSSFKVNQTIMNALEGIDVPNLDIYLKADLKVGPKVAWYGDNFFGHINLYGLLRVDTANKLTSANMTGDTASLDTPTDVEETNLTFDAAVGYRAENYSIIASMDEVKLASLSEADNANNLYGTPILFKLYGEMNFRPFDFMKLKAFGGIHKRTGYGIGDGYFLGADLGAYVWGDRLGIQFRTQLDAEHITLAPQLKFWVMQLEGMYKMPLSDEVEGRKTGSILGVNFRIFI